MKISESPLLLTMLIAIATGLIVLLLSYLPNQFFEWFSILGYKWLVIAILTLLLLLILTLFIINSYKINLDKAKFTSENESEEQKKREKAERESSMRNRTLSENRLLSQFIRHNCKMTPVFWEEEAPRTLETAGIVYLKATSLEGHQDCFIYDWVWEYLQEHKEDYKKYYPKNLNKKSSKI